MKHRFTTLDLIAILIEIKEKLIGNRVYQVYDIDNKTFLIRFSKPIQDNNAEEHLKQMLIFESGIRIHLTEYDWPKSSIPSGFTMKLRKHIKNKRLESIKQIQNDRVVDLQFGTNEFTNHIILELYSKGNIILTDKDYVILSLIRVYKDAKANINIAVREKYSLIQHMYIAEQATMSRDKILDILNNTKDQNFKKLFSPHFSYGPALLEHSLLQFKNVNANKYKVLPDDIDLLEKVFNYAESLVREIKSTSSKGYIILKREKRTDSIEDEILINEEFHPFLFKQYDNEDVASLEFENFNKAVDAFFSGIESQQIESKMIQQEKQAMKKLEAIKKDHEYRLKNLIKLQEVDNKKARLIENNIQLVDSAISVIRSAIANKYSWDMISEMVKDAQDNGDPIASRIHALKFEKNCFSMLLNDPYEENSDSMLVDIDIDISAYANARKFYYQRKDAAKKEQKTLDHSEKTFKNVERKVRQQLKETSIKKTIVMAKKILWFEKFFWFISSDGYLVIAGRDAQQNEMIFNLYLTKNDIYVHADIHGATSVVIKNHTEKNEIPPKTINEAANMAVCYSASWDAKVVSGAYWVYSHQVQKKAPSGQYLSVGSFMIRGKKNYVPLQNLILGFGILFRIDSESLERREQHKSLTSANDKEFQTQQQEQERMNNETSFPDTTIKYRDLLEEHMPKSDDSDYTIVNTGENIKKKVKIFSQKTIVKKANQLNAKKRDKGFNKNSKGKSQNDDNECEIHKATEDKEIEAQDHSNILEQNFCESKSEIENEYVNQNDDNAQDDEENVIEDEEDIHEKEHSKNDNQRIISSLVSNPTSEDNLLYAIPVCGPYTSLQSYKYKVKIVPGSMKRGKASKTALMMFLKEKSATAIEKNILKAMKDQEISKNMPAKVKIVAKIATK